MNQRSPLTTLLQGAAATFAGVIGGWIAYSRFGIDHNIPLPPAIDAERVHFDGRSSRNIHYYIDHIDQPEAAKKHAPLVLLHSINAAASAYEMKPLFEAYRGTRDVYAIDMPGFGFSERNDQIYSSNLYKEAILDLLSRIGKPADVIAFSLTSEFAASAALEHPEYFRSLSMISPAGFNAQLRTVSSAGAEKSGASDFAYRVLSFPLWSQAIYDLLTIKPSIHSFLQRSFIGAVDGGLEAYDYLTAHQPGARYATLFFVSGKLFASNIRNDVYAKISVPTLVLYDQDNFVRFDALPQHLEAHSNWHAARISPTLGLPHFEKLPDVIRALDDFWAAVTEQHPS